MGGGPRSAARPLLVLVLVVGTAATVQGHAIFRSASPGNGQLVPDPPDVVDVTYDAPIQEIRLAQVLDPDDRRVDRGPATVDPEDPRTIHVPVGNLSDGLYTVRWAVASADAHNVSGAFFFIVGDTMPTRQQLLARAGSGPAAPTLDPLEPPLRALVLVGVVALVGVALTSELAVRPIVGASRRTALGLGAAAVLLAVGASLLGLRRLTEGPPGTGIAAFLGRPAGIAWAGGVAGAAIAGLGTRLQGRVRHGAAVVGGVVAVVASAPTAHGTAIAGLAGALLDVGHVVAAGLWPGGLLALALAADRLGDATPEQVAGLVRRFSVLAIVGVGLGAATGLAMAAWHVPTATAWGATLYGRVLVLKVLLVGGALALGAYHRLVLHPRLEDGDRDALRRFRGSVRVEAAALLTALVLAAVLVAAPTGVAQLAGRDEGPAERTGRFRYTGPLQGEHVSTWIDVAGTVTPGRTGLNAVDVALSRRGEPVDADRVRVDATRLDRDVDLPPVRLDRTGPGTYGTVTALSLPGRWSVQVEVRLNGSLHHVTWTIPTGGDPVGPSGPLSTPLRGLAVLAGAATAGGLAWERRRGDALGLI